MAKKSERRVLGRGLSALLGDAGAELVASEAVAPPEPDAGSRAGTVRLPIDRIRPNPAQPRRTFREDELAELVESLRAHGVIQPILVRPDPAETGFHQLVAGERRWRAAQRAGVHELPAIVRELDDRQMLEMAIIENVQRVDLDSIEEAEGYARLVGSFGYTQEQLAGVIGKSRSHLANTMRLLTLPDRVRELVRDGKLSAGHARALINAEAPVPLAERAAAEGMSVRQVEALAKRGPSAERRKAQAGARMGSKKDADTRLLEADVSAAIGMRVRIDHGDEGSGEIRIRYGTLDQLDQLGQKLTTE